MKTAFEQLFRYGIVGFISNAVGYLLYLAVTAAGVEHKLAITLLYAVVVAQTFKFNKRWSFSDDGRRGHAFVRYCTTYAIGYMSNLSAHYIFVDHFGWPHQGVQALMVFVVAAQMFVLQKFWVFRAALERAKGLSRE